MKSALVARLDLSLGENEGRGGAGRGEICHLRKTRTSMESWIVRINLCVIILNRTIVSSVCEVSGVCAYAAPGPSRRPCLEFSRGFLGTTSINQVRECGDIILYYIMNYKQNSK